MLEFPWVPDGSALKSEIIIYKITQLVGMKECKIYGDFLGITLLTVHCFGIHHGPAHQTRQSPPTAEGSIAIDDGGFMGPNYSEDLNQKIDKAIKVRRGLERAGCFFCCF